MSGADGPTHVDARGLRCPWPALRLARVLREQAGPVTITADDPAAAREMAEVAAAAGRPFAESDADPGLFCIGARPA